MISKETKNRLIDLTTIKNDASEAIDWLTNGGRTTPQRNKFAAMTLFFLFPFNVIGAMIISIRVAGLNDLDSFLLDGVILNFLFNALHIKVSTLQSFYHLSIIILVITGFVFYKDRKTIMSSVDALKAKGTYLVTEEYVEQIVSVFMKSNDLAIDSLNSDDLMILAKAYESGRGISIDPEKSISLYSLAAEMKNPKAAYRVSQYFKEGNSENIDMDKYYQWLKYAEHVGSFDAMTELKELQTPTCNNDNSGSFIAGLAFGVLISSSK